MGFATRLRRSKRCGHVEWVAQVSLLRPGFLPGMNPRRNTQVSRARPGPLTQGLKVAAILDRSGKISVWMGKSDLQGERRQIAALVTT